MAEMPLFPLNVVLFPGMLLPLHIFEERYKLMINRCLDAGQPFGVVLIKYGQEEGGSAVPFEIGTSAVIAKVQQLPEERLNLIAVGQERFRILQIIQQNPYLVADVEPLTSMIGDDPEFGAVAGTVAALFEEYYRLQLAMDGQWARTFPMPDNPMVLADFVPARMTASNRIKQSLLETLSVTERLRREESILGEEVRALSVRLRQVQRQRYSSLIVLN